MMIRRHNQTEFMTADFSQPQLDKPNQEMSLKAYLEHR